LSETKNILVITYWSYNDALIQTYTLPYLRIIRDLLPEGSKIHLITLEKNDELKFMEESEPGILNTQFKLLPFGPAAILQWRKNLKQLRRICLENRISKIHTWCTPAGGIGYLLSKKTGIPLVLDSYEPHADAMVETGTWKKNGPAFQILHRLENRQTHRAEWLIGVVPGMKEYAKERFGYKGDNFLFKPACIDTQTFNLKRRKNAALLTKLGLQDKIVCVYAGKLGGLYLTESTFRFLKTAADFWGDKFHALLLTSADESEITAYCKSVSLRRDLVTAVFVPHNEMPDYMGLGDFAFSAFKPVPSRKYCTPIKNGEYWAMGLPVIIPDGISTDSHIIRSTNAGYVLKEMNDAEFNKACQHVQVLLNSETADILSNRIHQLAEKHRNFAEALAVYKTIYGNS
jgi:glycosyltransferase involved in cell wall biosynthesis